MKWALEIMDVWKCFVHYNMNNDPFLRRIFTCDDKWISLFAVGLIHYNFLKYSNMITI